MNLHRSISLITAATAWVALLLQLDLTIGQMTSQGATTLTVVWRFLSYFTIWSNIAVAVVATAMIFNGASAIIRLATVSTIAFVGIVFSVALRSEWQTEGWQTVANHLLHDVSPILFVLAWFFSKHGSLRWQDAGWAIISPLAYCIYALIRGANDGWYAYWFLDPTQLDVPRLIASIAALSVSFIILALVFVAIDKKLAR